ncbi:hypothetical protein BDZ91DRAFT_848199 [Kalaharituber pfeilii]|nr:hypothetical protein BDZ91DRAFT_848199 [Kalaharituber pfeilii]
MSAPRRSPVLRVSRTDTDSPDKFVLLRPHPSTTSASSLDLYLLATESVSAYSVKIKHTRVHKFLNKSFTGTLEEFQTILSALLLRKPVEDKDKALLDGVELSATVDDGTITLAVRKSVGGIKQRIATIDIPETEDEISLYDWLGDTCSVRDETEAKLYTLEAKAAEHEKQVTKLIVQLKDLAALKKEHEDAMLVKFQDVLNSKKQQIRNLTRLLEVGGKQRGSTEEAALSKSNVKTKNPRKRTANPVEEEEESDGGFAVAVNKADDDEDDVDPNQLSDPRTTEDEAEIEMSADDITPQSAPISKPKKLPVEKGRGKRKIAASNSRKSRGATITSTGPSRTNIGDMKKKAAFKSAVNKRGKGKGKARAQSSEHLESISEMEDKPLSANSPSAAPRDDSDATEGATDDDEL